MVLGILGTRTITARSVADRLSSTPQGCDDRGATAPGGALTLRAALLAWPCRAVGVRMRWRRHCIVPCCATLPAHLHGRPGASPRAGLLGRLEVEADEMGRCVQPKANKQGVWRALDTQTRHIMAFHIGDCSHARAPTVVGAWAGSIPRAGDVLDGSICRLHRDHADGPPESHHAARPETQS